VLALPTGQRYKGASPEEVWQQVAAAQVSASQTIRDISLERDRYRRGIQTISGAPEVDPATGQAKPVFDHGIFENLWGNDPMMGMQYMLQHLFGLNSIDEVVPTLEDVRYQTRDYAYQMAINRFRAAAPDFPGTQQAVDALLDTMKAHNMPFTSDALVMVHNALKQQNRYPVAQQQPPQGQQPQGQQPPPPQPAFNPNPQGPYAYEMGRGFGPPAVFAPPAPPQPQYQAPPNPYQQPPNPYAAPPAPPGFAPMGPQGYAPTPPPGFYQPAPGTFPTMPAMQTPPLPTVQPGMGMQPGSNVVDEGALNNMDRATLRAALESGLPR
jgi:hypothetical protein